MSKLIYLIATKANKKIFFSYIKNFILNFFYKRKRKIFINNYRNFLNTKKYTFDFFSQNTFDWARVLSGFKKKNFNYLEIGSFEGNSALFIFKFFNPMMVCCCDSWTPLTERDGSDEGYSDFDMPRVEKNFNYNLRDYQNRLKKYKMKSDQFFKKNQITFDIIYVDGSHFGEDVSKDCYSSWQILNKNGILIFDDYFWKSYTKIESNPAYAINRFLDSINGKYEVLYLSKFQLFIKKL
jgi:hypothetical protein